MAEANFINGEINERQKLALAAATESNETYRNLAAQLILIAGTVITISAAFLEPKGVLGPHARTLLIFAWVAFTSSIGFGITSLLVDARFFEKWKSYHFQIAERLGTGKYNSSNIGSVRDGIEPPKGSSSLWPLCIQIALLAIGGISFLVLIIHLQLSK